RHRREPRHRERNGRALAHSDSRYESCAGHGGKSSAGPRATLVLYDPAPGARWGQSPARELVDAALLHQLNFHATVLLATRGRRIVGHWLLLPESERSHNALKRDVVRVGEVADDRLRAR